MTVVNTWVFAGSIAPLEEYINQHLLRWWIGTRQESDILVVRYPEDVPPDTLEVVIGNHGAPEGGHVLAISLKSLVVVFAALDNRLDVGLCYGPLLAHIEVLND